MLFRSGAPVFGQEGLYTCPSGTTSNECEVSAPGKWMAGMTQGGNAFNPRSAFYLLAYGGMLMPVNLTAVYTNSNRGLDLSPGGNTVGGSTSSSSIAMRWGSSGVPKILACSGPPQMVEQQGVSSAAGGFGAGRAINCETPAPRLNILPYGVLSGPVSPVAVSVLHWKGSTFKDALNAGGSTVSYIGVELANYKSTTSSGAIDYVVYAEGLANVSKKKA